MSRSLQTRQGATPPGETRRSAYIPSPLIQECPQSVASGYTHWMTTTAHNLKPGYYWYTMDKDPLAIIHIHEDGGATLMGTDFRMAPEGVANMIQQGESFFWIEPPAKA